MRNLKHRVNGKGSGSVDDSRESEGGLMGKTFGFAAVTLHVRRTACVHLSSLIIE